MPTGFTADLTEETSFPEFVLRCAHGMGALILMRDDPLDAPIKEFEPSDYHQKAIEEAKLELASLREMTLDDAAKDLRKHNAHQLAERERIASDSSRLSKRYRRMRHLVKAWQPPTNDHDGLKRFMLEQLQTSENVDCHDQKFAEQFYPTFDGTPEDWRANRIAKAERDLAYHEVEWSEEQRRTRERNEWVRELRESLKQ
jgi:AraC-like DNA-binding protein